MAYSRCCVPGCNISITSNTKLHRFPHPEKDSKRFNTWLQSIGGSILSVDKKTIYNNRRVCRFHFDDNFHFGTKLTGNAIPTINIQGNIKKADAESKCSENIEVPGKKYGLFYRKSINNKKQNELDKLIDVEKADDIPPDITLDKVTSILGSDCDDYRFHFDGEELMNVVVIDGRTEATEGSDTLKEQPLKCVVSTEPEQNKDTSDQPALSPQSSESKIKLAFPSKKGKQKSQISVNELKKSVLNKNLAIAKYYECKRKNEEELHLLRKKQIQLEILAQKSKVLKPFD